jgi:hypothetical protein
MRGLKNGLPMKKFDDTFFYEMRDFSFTTNQDVRGEAVAETIKQQYQKIFRQRPNIIY